MTTLLVASDTHGDLQLLQRTLAAHPEVSAVLHLGDFCEDAVRLAGLIGVPVHGVCGNGDYACRHGCPLETVVTVEGRRILIGHGHRFEVKSGLSRLTAHAASIRPPVDIALFGHTHRPSQRIVERHEGGRFLLLNPGTARIRPRPGDSAASCVLLRIGEGIGLDGIAVEWVGGPPP